MVSSGLANEKSSSCPWWSRSGNSLHEHHYQSESDAHSIPTAPLRTPLHPQQNFRAEGSRDRHDGVITEHGDAAGRACFCTWMWGSGGLQSRLRAGPRWGRAACSGLRPVRSSKPPRMEPAQLLQQPLPMLVCVLNTTLSWNNQTPENADEACLKISLTRLHRKPNSW